MALHDDEPQLHHQIQTPHSLLLQDFSCHEDLRTDEEEEEEEEEEHSHFWESLTNQNDPLMEEEDDLELLHSLVSKQDQPHFCYDDGFPIQARTEALSWILRVKNQCSFSALTHLLAVNYFDRFVSNVRFQRDKPWMSQLVAVACLSLAAKVEETHVPLLLDLQVVESKFLFEAKTIQRMELLVLSALQWKMHPVTPFSFFHHIVRRLPLKNNVLWELLGRFQNHLLSIIADHKFLCYLPSVLATATILHIINEREPYNFLEYQNELLCVLQINKNHLDECYKLIIDSLGRHGNPLNSINKSKQMCGPCSPDDVMDGYFISDSSNDSWQMVPSISP